MFWHVQSWKQETPPLLTKYFKLNVILNCKNFRNLLDIVDSGLLWIIGSYFHRIRFKSRKQHCRINSDPRHLSNDCTAAWYWLGATKWQLLVIEILLGQPYIQQRVTTIILLPYTATNAYFFKMACFTSRLLKFSIFFRPCYKWFIYYRMALMTGVILRYLIKTCNMWSIIIITSEDSERDSKRTFTLEDYFNDTIRYKVYNLRWISGTVIGRRFNERDQCKKR